MDKIRPCHPREKFTMAFRMLAAAVAIIAALGTVAVSGASSVEAATKYKTVKVVTYKKVPIGGKKATKSKKVVKKYGKGPKVVVVVTPPGQGPIYQNVCTGVTITGGGILKGLAGTEAKARVLAVNDWQRQANAKFGAGFNWGASNGQQVTCKRSILTVRCLAISTPCRG
jgi:hypothetical protein